METLTTARISELRAFRDCPRKREIAFDYSLKPQIEAPYFAFGTAYHAARRGADWSLDPFETARLQAMLEKIPGGLYGQRLTEIPFTITAGRMLRLQGHIDAVVEYQGRYMVLERKTTSKDLDADYFAALAMDDQVHGYYLGAHGSDMPVDGVLWEVVKKPGIRPYKATPLEKRTYNKTQTKTADGVIRPAGSLSAKCREFDETPVEFYARCLEAFDPVTDYALREVAVTTDRVESFKQDVAAQLRSIRDGASWRNPQACPDCPFTGICHNEMLATETPDGFIRDPSVSSPEASPAQPPAGS